MVISTLPWRQSCICLVNAAGNKKAVVLLTWLRMDFEKVFTFYISGDVTTQVALQPALKFNGGGHINHSIFWTNLSPKGGGEPKGWYLLIQLYPWCTVGMIVGFPLLS